MGYCSSKYIKKSMKGIILAGGSGTRLNPLTSATSKQLLPVYDKPLIYYPLTTLISLGIQDILIISSPDQLHSFESLLKDGSNFGINLSYKAQDKPRGIAEALIIGEPFLDGANCCLVLGDNIFVSNIFKPSLVENFAQGATVFTAKVNDPERYGVISMGGNGLPERIVEKPIQFVSNDAVTGLYFYDHNAPEFCRALSPSARNEIEITDLNKKYLANNNLNVVHLDESSAWMDAGTFSSLHDSSSYISSMQKRIGIPIGSPEYAALKNSLITPTEILTLLDKAPSNEYYQLLRKALEL